MTQITQSRTPAEYAHSYHQQGFVYPITLMSPAAASDYRQDLERAEAEHGPMHYRVKPYLLLRSVFDIATNSQLLDIVEAILGPDILLWDSSFVIKEPHTDGFVSWHQDLTYWGLTMESDDDLVSAWVALSPATPSSGCMQFVSGSHRRGRFAHDDTFDADNILHRGQRIATRFSDDEIEFIELAPGQASLHQGWAVHSSTANQTDDRRIGLVLNYIKPSVRQVVGDYEAATLVRGQDRFGYYVSEPRCQTDFAPQNIEFQRRIEAKKRDVYDNA